MTKQTEISKQRVEISHSLNSTTPNIIWNLIGSADGLARWVADEVTADGDTLTFTWGSKWSHHEIRKATILKQEKLSCLQFRWEDEEDEDAFVELRMEKHELSNDYMLHIVDFAMPEDIDSLRAIWADNLDKLHHSSGL